jgi:Protein of unknown function (DUF1566)
MKKVFLMSFVSVCFGITGLVLWTGQAYSKRVSPETNLPGCQKNLEMCTSDLGTCEDDLAQCEAQPAAPVPQTGQTTCWDSGGSVIACAGTGQDGDIRAGVEWPNPRFTDNMDGTITDNLTHLIWLQDANCFGTRTWAQALDDANSLNSGQCDLTDGSVEGDWRLPTVRELASLIDYEKSVGTVLPSPNPFMNFQSDLYWSSTTVALNTSGAWSVGFSDGFVLNFSKPNNNFVLPVRGGT